VVARCREASGQRLLLRVSLGNPYAHLQRVTSRQLRIGVGVPIQTASGS
jgi:hypothetical protein